MFRLLRSLWIWTASLLLVLLWVPLVVLVRLFDFHPLRLRTARCFRRLGKVLRAVNPWQVRISGQDAFDPGRAYVIVSNHQSFIDIPVRRTDRRSSARAVLRAAKYLRDGCSVVFFPEGTRSPDGRVLPFNDGPFQLAIREGVPVLPLAISGSGEALPRDSWRFGPPREIGLRVLPAVSTDCLTTRDTHRLQEAVRDMIASELAGSAVRL
jgi:1-acyl-sn-glycerol-3-phosphate acyltransferase